MRNKVLIIKLGLSETLDAEVSQTTSLGDVLRTTVVLHNYKDDHVTWLVDEKAYQLLDGNPYINRLLIIDALTLIQLQQERFDVVINFEKVPGLCALANSLKAWKKLGFRFDESTGEAMPFDHCEKLFYLCKDNDLKRAHKKSWQESLYEIIGGKWEEQEYVLGYQPKTEEIYDVGLNWAVGTKWPNKMWPEENWTKFTSLIEGKYTYSRQKGLNDIHAYIDWINQCRLLVTNDSLGLHLALALKKKVVVVYGPTNPNETFFYGRGIAMFPDVDYDCIPCLKPTCDKEKTCLNFIYPEDVFMNVEKLFASKDKNEVKLNYKYDEKELIASL